MSLVDVSPLIWHYGWHTKTAEMIKGYGYLESGLILYYSFMMVCWKFLRKNLKETWLKQSSKWYSSQRHIALVFINTNCAQNHCEDPLGVKALLQLSIMHRTLCTGSLILSCPEIVLVLSLSCFCVPYLPMQEQACLYCSRDLFVCCDVIKDCLI